MRDAADHFILFALMVQLDRTFVYEAKGSGFESRSGRIWARSSDWSERISDKDEIIGSSVLSHLPQQRMQT